MERSDEWMYIEKNNWEKNRETVEDILERDGWWRNGWWREMGGGKRWVVGRDGWWREMGGGERWVVERDGWWREMGGGESTWERKEHTACRLL